MCLRCQKSKVICDGYSISPQPMLFDYEASIEERRRMAVLVECTIPSIETCNKADHEFWTRTALQAAHRCTSLRHALLSVQAYRESLSDPKDHSPEHLQYAQTQYSAAIRAAAAAQYRSEDVGFGELASLSIVFRCIEVLRNDYDNAAMHLNGGRHVLDTASESNVHSDPITDLLIPIFHRLEFRSMAVSTLVNGDIATSDGGIERAREMGHAVLSLISHGVLRKAKSAPSLDSFLACLRLICKQWYQEVCVTTEQLPAAGPATEAAIYCKIQYFLTTIALRAGTAEDDADLEDVS